MKLFIQLIGFAGMAAFLLSYQTKSNKALFIFQALGAMLFCAQFCLMGAFSGCFTLILGFVRCIMLNYYQKYQWIRWKGWSFILSAGFVLIMIFTWKGMASLLIAIASIASTFAYWTNNAGKLRIVNLCLASPCWIVYDVIVGSWGGVASEAFTMGSILVSGVRFGWKHLLDKDSDFQK